VYVGSYGCAHEHKTTKVTNINIEVQRKEARRSSTFGLHILGYRKRGKPQPASRDDGGYLRHWRGRRVAEMSGTVREESTQMYRGVKEEGIGPKCNETQDERRAKVKGTVNRRREMTMT
jgi:hypothetical protein